MLPQGPDDGLTPHIPNGEADVLVVHRLHVKACKSPDVKLLSALIHVRAGGKKSLTDSWNGGDDLSQLQLVEQSGLSCSVQTHCGEKHPVRLCGGLLLFLMTTSPYGDSFPPNPKIQSLSAQLNVKI